MTFESSNYFSFPLSWQSPPSNLRAGLVAVASIALLSALTTFAALAFITCRFTTWKAALNQPLVLIFNLLLGDLFQAVGFALDFHWYRIDAILAPSTTCRVQGAFINFGDLASGLFVLAIAIHTWYSIARGQRMNTCGFYTIVSFAWLLSFVLTIIGPIQHGNSFFVRAGNWCWINQAYETERLVLHYLWIFIAEFGTLILYTFLYVHLRTQVKMASRNGIETGALSRIAHAQRYMLLYPAIYLCLTLPLAIGRMITSAGGHVDDTYLLVAGCLFCSCGFFDAFMYTFTRRIFASDGNSRNFHDPGSRSTCSDGARHTKISSDVVRINVDGEISSRRLTSGILMMPNIKGGKVKHPSERWGRIFVHSSISERALTAAGRVPTLLTSGSANTLDSIDSRRKSYDDFDPDAKMALFNLDGTAGPPSSANNISPLTPRTATSPSTVHTTLRDRIFRSERTNRHGTGRHTASRRELPWADRSMRSRRFAPDGVRGRISQEDASGWAILNSGLAAARLLPPPPPGQTVRATHMVSVTYDARRPDELIGSVTANASARHSSGFPGAVNLVDLTNAAGDNGVRGDVDSWNPV